MNPHEVQMYSCLVAVSLTTSERIERAGPRAAARRYAGAVPAHPPSKRRPASAEELNTGAVTEARQAASVILLRDAPAGPEVLLVQRNPEQRFMGGVWVFPGGALHADDTDHVDAGVRELEEEAGIALPDRDALVPFSRWITPPEVRMRFDTRFFAARAPEGAEATADGSECVAARWLRPEEALAAHDRDELTLVLPTIRQLEELSPFASVAQALEAARGRSSEAIQPRIVMRAGSPRVLLPGDPGFDVA
jgi:8-oxo-dGTP pyrophosphatase MutT (NUDIX family)